MKFCSQCGAQQADDARFCTECSASLEETAAPATETPAAEAPVAAPAAEAPVAAPAKKPALSKKMIALIAGGLAIVILLGILIACFAGGSGEPVYGIYYKDGEVYIVDFESEEPILLTDDLGIWGSDILSATVMTPDGSYVFYPDEIDSGSKSVTIFYRDTLDPEADPIKMAAKVTEYFVADDSKTVLYVTEKGELCRYSISDQESESIAKNVIDFDCSEDGRNILYRTSVTKNDKTVENSYRIMDGNIEEPVQLPKMYEYDTSEDLSVILYEEEHKETDKADKKYKTYMLDANGEETLIDSDVANVWIMEDNSVYYTKAGKAQKVSKFIKNDTNDGTDLSVFDQYEIAFYEFYKFDGEAVLITDGIANINCESYEKAVFSYTIADVGGKVKLSELYENIYDISDASWYIREQLVDGYGFIAGDEVGKIDYDEIYRYRFTEEFDRIYVISEWEEEENSGTLYVADVDGVTVGEFEKVAEEVKNAMFLNGDLYYLQDGDMYIEGEKKAIAKDSMGAMYVEETDTIYVAYDQDDAHYALGIYDGELTEICGKVDSVLFMENGVVVYEDDDDVWYYYVNGEATEIDDDLNFRQIRIGGWAYLYLPGSNNY